MTEQWDGSPQDSHISEVLRVALAQAADSVMVTDPGGAILYVNGAFERLTGYRAHEAIGKNPRILSSGKHDAGFYATYWGEILAGRPWRGEVVNRRKDGTLYTEEHAVTPVLDAAGNIQFFMCIGQDVTRREQMLRELQLLESLTVIIATAADTGSALRAVLAEVCNVTNWDLGKAWSAPASSSALECVAWFAADRERFAAFRRVTEAMVLLPGEGMPGRAWLSRKPEWNVDVTTLVPGSFPREQAARAAGIQAGFAVPICWHDDVFAVLAFFVTESREEDTYLLGIISSVATQLGDLFQRKRVQEERARLAAIVESSVDAIISLDAEGMVTSWNRGARILYGYSQSEMLRRSIQRIIPFERRAEQASLIESVLAGESIRDVETVRLTRSGSHVDILLSLSPIVDHNGRVTGIATIARDITERRRAERKLREQEYALREAQRVARVGSWQWDAANDDMYWSHEMHRIAGTDSAGTMPAMDERLGMYTPESSRRLAAARDEAMLHGTPYELDLERVMPDGTHRFVTVRGEPMRSADGTITGLRGTMQDITERRRVEEQLRQAQKMDSIGRLAGGVAHDFNNLLTAVMGFTHLAIEELPEDHPVRTDLGEVLSSARRGAELTRQLLAFARQQPADPSVLDLNDVLSDLYRLLVRLIGEDVSLTLELAAEPAWVLIDRSQVEQVIVNLAANARDAMPGGGRLTFRVDHEPGAGIVRLAASDTGGGIDNAVLPHLFEPFFTTKPPGKGTGLGLATCYGIIQDAGGEISVESNLGTGTTFVIGLPRAGIAVAGPPGQQHSLGLGIR